MIIKQKLVKIKRKYHSKYTTTQEFNKLTAEDFAERLKEANLATKSDVTNSIIHNKFKNIDKKITSNKTKHVDDGKK